MSDLALHILIEYGTIIEKQQFPDNLTLTDVEPVFKKEDAYLVPVDSNMQL